MAENGESGNGEPREERRKPAHTWAMIAGIVFVVYGVVQSTGGNTPLGFASLVLGAAATVFGYLRLGRKT